MPKRGDIAFCSKGLMGLITCDKPTIQHYRDGSTNELWKGIQLTEKDGREIGGPWCSRSPHVVGHLSLAIDLFNDYLKEFANSCLRAGEPL